MQIDKIRAREMLALFDAVRIAVNGDKQLAQEYRDSLLKRTDVEQDESPIVIASNEDLDRMLGRL